MIGDKTNNLMGKLFKKDAVYIILIFFYVVLFTIQINLRSFERYPGWDHWWMDVRTAGMLVSLQQAISSLELPSIIPYTGFGWNLAGDHHSFWGIFNLLIMVFSPGTVIMLSQMIFLILAGIGAYLFLKLITNNKFISFFGGLIYISIPFVISLSYYNYAANSFYAIPLFLVLIHKILERQTIKRLLFFVLFSIVVVSASDIHSLLIFPVVTVLYSFLIAYRYYRLGFLNSLKRTSILLLLFVLASSFYIVPLYSNLHTIGEAISSLKAADILTGGYTGLSVGFLSIFQKLNGFRSLLRPFEGSALLLYIPAFFYIVIILAFIFKDVVFEENQKQVSIIYTLVLLGITMFFMSVIFYSPIVSRVFPGLTEGARGAFRYHINLIPFVNLLAGFICFAALNNSKNNKVKMGLYALLIVSCLLIDFELFSRGPLEIDKPFGSSNRISIPFDRNALHFLPWINISFVAFLFSCTFFGGWDRRNAKSKIVYPVFIILAMVLPLLSISVYNEWFAQGQGGRQPHLARDPYRWESFLERKVFIDGIIDRYDINYRTLYAGKGKVISSDGRDWKLIAETELHVMEREKVLFSYKEFVHPYTGLMRGTFVVGREAFQRSNIMPPLSREIAHNIETMKLMGVKWVISADEEINSPDLIYRGKCVSEEGPRGRLGRYSEGGPMFVYELVDPTGIVFLVDNYERVTLTESLRVIYEDREYPWNDNIVYLEKDPIDEEKLFSNELGDTFSGLESRAEIRKETFNSIEINTSSPEEKYMVLSYLYRPNWKAYISSSEIEVYRAYGGFMSVKVPPGEHTVNFKYYPLDVYLGLILTVIAFLIPFGIVKTKGLSK